MIDAPRVDGTGHRQIVHNWTVTIKSPSVSPDGASLAYSVFCATGLSTEPLSIWVTPFSTNTNPCEGRRLTPVDELEARRPAWGPADIFAYERVDATTNVAAIALLARTPDSRPCNLTADFADNRNPAWAPDAASP